MSETKKAIRGVAAIITEGERVLATQRGHGAFKGMWEFPGGKMEAGETEEESIVREIREELNVGIRVEKKVCTVEYDYPQFHLRMHCFWCSIAEGMLELKEHQSARWLAKEEWESVDWLPADVLVLEQLG